MFCIYGFDSRRGYQDQKNKQKSTKKGYKTKFTEQKTFVNVA